ncbi:MerR family transcriptional regulator [Halobacteriovorax sp. HLS]|uniref:MerR family transcriptional regulator n=1 Tax=Halobacteriovorax sp. HLS TaxID=2234000 RepID=UPI000FDB00FB|nr:MerR family transcriptional regulator [Halobacteriovorax sp. HLS]
MSIYSISQVSKITEIPALTLRAWENRYQAVTPNRSTSGYREYTKSDIKKLRYLKALTTQGHSISKVANKSIKELEALIKEYEGHSYIINEKALNTLKESEIEKIVEGLLLALKEYRLEIITHELKKIKLNLRPKDLVFKVLSPLLQRVGQMVYDERLSISHEHALSSIIKFHIGQYIYSEYESSSGQRQKIALTTMEGELHEFGILLASLLCLEYDHEIIYLGPNLPPLALLETVKALDISTIIIGTHYSAKKSYSNNLTEYIRTITYNISKSQKLILGGPGRYNKDQFKNTKNLLPMESFIELDKYLAQL